MSFDITVFRLIALFISSSAILYLLRLVYLRRIRGLEFVLWLTLTLAVFILSIFPSIIILVFHYLTLSIINRYDRLAGLSFIFIFFSLVIIFYYRNRLYTFRKQFLATVQVTAARQFIDKHRDEKGKYEIFILIPAFNEGENIGQVLRRIPEHICGLSTRAIVISDGSTDNTVQVSEQEGAQVVEHPVNFGGGMALKTGYRIAVPMEARYVATLDADGQYQPEEVERLLQPIINGEADVVSGSRTLGYYEQKFTRKHFIRSLGVKFFNIVLTVMTWKRITDSSSGFRAIKVEFLPRLNLIEEQFHSSEFLLECLKNELRFEEVPISFLKRISGDSKKPKSLWYSLGFVRAMLKTWMRRA